jgi:hypothetical protein
VADDPNHGPNHGPGAGPGPGRSEPLYDEHEPTEKVERVSVTLHGVSQDAAAMLRPAPNAKRALSQGASGDAPRTSSPDMDGPVFVSMKPPSEREDRTEIVPAIDRPDMRPRLRPVTEPPAWHLATPTLGNYATPRPGSHRKRSWLWLYVVLSAGAALVGAGVTLWLRSIW